MNSRLFWILILILPIFLMAQTPERQEKVFNVNVSTEKKILPFEPLETTPQMRSDSTLKRAQTYNTDEADPLFSPQTDSIQALKLGISEVLDSLNRMYIKTGANVVGIAPLAEIYFNGLRDQRFQYGIWHHFFWNPIWFPENHRGVEDEFSSRSAMDNFSRAWFKYMQKDWKIGTNLHYNRSDIHYYGFDHRILEDVPSTSDLAQYWQNIGFDAYFQSHFDDPKKFNWLFRIQYDYFNERHRAHENKIALETQWSAWLKKFYLQVKAHLDFDAYRPSLWYFNNLGVPVLNDQLSSVFYLHPQLFFNEEKVEFKLGFLLGGDFGLKQFLGFPDFEIRFLTLNKKLTPYLGISGSYQRNDLQYLADQNAFIHSAQILKNTLVPAHIYLGLGARIAKNFGLDIALHYENVQDPAFFLPDPIIGNTFFAAYGKSYHQLQLGGSLTYQKTDQLNVMLSGYYYFYAFRKDEIPSIAGLEAELWYRPNFTTDLRLEWWAHPKWKTFAKLFVTGNRPALIVTDYDDAQKAIFASKNLPVYADLNLGVEYFFKPRFTLWTQLNNVANQIYERYAGYNVQGIQFWLGITYRFW